MPFNIDEKLVIAIASSALFDLSESDGIFKKRGEKAYRNFQKKNIAKPLPKGVAFPFIKRLLKLNKLFPELEPVEVILLSRNDPDSGRRIFRSAKYYKLNITRGAFLTGKSPHDYIPAFNASLFLSANKNDVQKAIKAKYPAGVVLPSQVSDDNADAELRIAFDFDGVLCDDEAEAVFRKGGLKKFHKYEQEKMNIPHNPGPLQDLIKKIAIFQNLERLRKRKDGKYKRKLRVALVTTRNAPANERLVTTINSWGMHIDETFLLGGIEKKRILKILKPHIFFDDQLRHLEPTFDTIPSVHIPFGIANMPSRGK